MRELTHHKLAGLNDALRIEVLDEPGPGNACHDYAISFHDERYGCDRSPLSERFGRNCIIGFQKGPVAEAGVNGISNESLLAVLIDRMQGFQSGPFACRDNAIALTHLEEALMWLQKRTQDRLARGVEGTNQK